MAPTLQVIEQLVKAHAPVVKLHQDYQPSGVEWYLERVQYRRVDGGTREPPVGPPARGLRNGDAGKADFLQIPDAGRGNIIRGNLSSAKALVMVRGLDGIGLPGWIDLEYWFFYPYNGPGSARLEIEALGHDANINIDFLIFGEHEGDWEHVTLRLLHFSDVYVPIAMYFAQHDGGEWVPAGNLEKNADGRPIVYSSRDGHASFPSAGIFPTKKANISFNVSAVKVRGFLANYCNNNTVTWDTQNASEIVSIRFIDGATVAAPDWLPFLGRWGMDWTPAEREARAAEAIQKMHDAIVQKLPAWIPSPVTNELAKTIKDAVIAVAPLDEFVPEGPRGLMEKEAWSYEEGEPVRLGWNMYVAPPDSNVANVLGSMTKFISGFDKVPGVLCTTKMAASNQKGGDARGVIYYYIGEKESEPLYGSEWEAQIFSTSNNYMGDLFTPGLSFLATLQLEQALTAQVSMSNAQNTKATLTVWWPRNANPPA